MWWSTLSLPFYPSFLLHGEAPTFISISIFSSLISLFVVLSLSFPQHHFTALPFCHTTTTSQIFLSVGPPSPRGPLPGSSLLLHGLSLFAITLPPLCSLWAFLSIMCSLFRLGGPLLCSLLGWLRSFYSFPNQPIAYWWVLPIFEVD